MHVVSNHLGGLHQCPALRSMLGAHRVQGTQSACTSWNLVVTVVNVLIFMLSTDKLLNPSHTWILVGSSPCLCEGLGHGGDVSWDVQLVNSSSYLVFISGPVLLLFPSVEALFLPADVPEVTSILHSLSSVWLLG